MVEVLEEPEPGIRVTVSTYLLVLLGPMIISHTLGPSERFGMCQVTKRSAVHPIEAGVNSKHDRWRCQYGDADGSIEVTTLSLP